MSASYRLAGTPPAAGRGCPQGVALDTPAEKRSPARDAAAWPVPPWTWLARRGTGDVLIRYRKSHIAEQRRQNAFSPICSPKR